MIIVLTGGIASGKTYVRSLFSEYGFVPIDTDSLAHQALEECKQELVKAFGEEILEQSIDGISNQSSINRRVLGDIIFSAQEKRILLETIIHPRIAEIRHYKINCDPFRPIIVEIPLFFEIGVQISYDFIISTVCSIDTQRKRAMMRKGMTDPKFNAIVTAQLTNQERIKLSDYVIDTDNSKAYVRNRVEKFLREYVRNKRNNP